MRNVYELYIDGLLCDLSSDESVSLVYQSGLFSELNAIQSNRSYTIDLPITDRNMAIVELANRPDVDTTFPYEKHRAALYSGGMALFTDGFAVITEITDESISVVLTWGNVENFDPLFDANLRDLGEVLATIPNDTKVNSWCAHVDWNKDSRIPEQGVNVGFFGVDYGMGLSDPKYVHPSIMVGTVLQAIEQYHGITIEDKHRLSEDLFLPCVSKNADEVSNKAEAIEGSPTLKSSNYAFSYPTWFQNSNTPVYTQDPRGFAESDSGYFIKLGNDNQCNKLHIEIKGANGEDRFYIRGYSSSSNPLLRIIADLPFDEATDQKISAANWKYTTMGSTEYVGNMYNIYFASISIDLDVSDVSEGICIYFPSISSGSAFWSVKIYGDWEDVGFPSKFPIAANLPDMSHGDFIASLMTLNGLYAYIDAPNTIKLMSVDNILENIRNDKVVDWSNRVLANPRYIDTPESTQYTIDDYAQENSLDYDNDDDVKADTVGYINIENRTLEKENEMVQLDFSATDNTGMYKGVSMIAKINAYTKEDIDDLNDFEGEIEFNKPGATYSEPSPRILSLIVDEITGDYYGRFTREQYFGGPDGIVATKYASLQKILNRFRIITVRLMLTAKDLFDLDYRKPVYLAQFGQYFAIYKIETQDNGVCECQLIQLQNS